MGWFMPENRHFVHFSAVGDSHKKCFLDVQVCFHFKTEYLKNERSFFNEIFSESLYIHVLLAQRILAL
jgi:hypothetical protein